MTPVELVLSRLHSVRRSGKGWRARCPFHEGRRADALLVSEGDRGNALLYCYAGCPQREMVAAMGLEMRDLFVRDDGYKPAPPSLPKRPLTDAEIAVLSVRQNFVLEWETTAKLLARVPTELARQDVNQSREYLTARMDVDFVWNLAGAIRGTALLRYGKAHLPGYGLPAAVDRLLDVAGVKKPPTYPHSDEAVGYVATAPYCPECDSDACMCVRDAP